MGKWNSIVIQQMELLLSFLLFFFLSLHLHFCMLVCIKIPNFPQISPSYSLKFIHKEHSLFSHFLSCSNIFLCKTCYLLNCLQHIYFYLPITNIWYSKGHCKINPTRNIYFPTLAPKYNCNFFFPKLEIPSSYKWYQPLPLLLCQDSQTQHCCTKQPVRFYCLTTR